MLYYLFYEYLRKFFSFLNIFQYITVRASGAFITSLLLSLLFGSYVIKLLKSKKVIQVIREDGPKHHISKSGTPTMGGMLIICNTIISVLLWTKVLNRFILVLLFSTIYLGVLGFFDDYLKICKKSSRGVPIGSKFIFQMILAVIVSSYFYFFPPNAKFSTHIMIPYLKETFVQLGWLYIFFSYLIVIGSANAVNITDGLDGLAIGVSIVSYATYGIFAYVGGNVKFAEYLKIVYVPGAGEISVFIAAVIGAGLGFLWYNSYPAAIFMGDIGSLFLGGVLGIVALMIKQEILLFLVGGVFIIEILTVVLQVYFFRKKGYRLFKMAPLHHHFELQNIPEPKITVRFWIVSIIFCLIALGALKIR